jgi:hypothetical protein
MHPYLEYIIVQQRAEQLRREAEYQRLIREIRPRTRGPFALRVLRWLGFDSTRSLAEKDAPSMSTITELSHENCGRTCRTEDEYSGSVRAAREGYGLSAR